MSYSKVTFDVDVPLSISNLNMLGLQYSEMLSDITEHNHDDLYYNKTTSNGLYVFADNDGEGSGCDALTIDGYTKTELISSIPKDLIILYAGNIATLNAGGSWHLCDGTNGTRNLLDKYVICCAADGADIGATGGINSYTLTGTITIDSHVLTTNEIPSHNHSIYNRDQIYGLYNASILIGKSSFGSDNYGTEYFTTRDTGYVGSNQGHGHSGSTFTGLTFDKRPISKAIYYIQKL